MDRTLRSWRCTEALDVVALLTSELVTNAILHAGTEVSLRLRRLPQRLRVEVTDGSVRTPVPRHYTADAQTGRGLLLIESLADRWGVERLADGKVVWFEVAA